MVRFKLLEPEDLSEAISLLAEYRENVKIIAGGQGLLPLLKHRQIKPGYLMNIKGLAGLEYINDDDNSLRIGALTTHRTIQTSDLMKKKFPVITEMEERLGCVQTRNWGTLVGNLCSASPTGDPAPVLIALKARVKAACTRGERWIPLDSFFIGYQRTALELGEVVVELEIPILPSRTGAAYHKESMRWMDSPIASVAAVTSLDEELKAITDARILLQAVGLTPVRAKKAEKVVIGQNINDGLLEEMATVAATEACPISDVYGSEEYKRDMVRVAANGVVSKAVERARASQSSARSSI